MKAHPLVPLMLASCCLATPQARAFDVVEAGQPVVTGDPSRVGPPWNHRSTFNIPGTDTDVAFGGYAKLDMFYDFDYDLGTSTTPFNVLDDGNRTDGRTSFTAAESRLNFRTHTRTGMGVLTSYFEGHFMPDEKFNLRHAYGEMNGLLAGQTWTNFMSFVATPRTLALGSPKGYAFDRKAQLRYTRKLGSSTLAVALEDPDTVIARAGAQPDPNSAASGENGLPDLTVRYEYRRMFTLSLLARELSTNGEQGSVDDSATGYGALAQISLPLFNGLTFKGNVIGGTGIGNYMGNPGNTGHRRAPDVYVRNGHLETVDLSAFGASLNQTFNRSWFASVGYSRLRQDLPENLYGEHFETLDYGFANVIWDVTDRMMVGMELQRVDLEQVNGESETANRLQTSLLYQF
ncbi:DcaP family trimeric outer membrane transporter [Alloalcanivorax marinus]|uniref:DcaP family trimeric outer membrane transporter n=1 Tax=Alloalcanivorax marinus TaxID=1177169 RepID=UPI001933FCA4|nr:DcaP family trimeric outer membrane transporter [Alloalcanivorax marinus]MBL7249664.1 porin [Alloalcanivorax marinus]